MMEQQQQHTAQHSSSSSSRAAAEEPHRQGSQLPDSIMRSALKGLLWRIFSTTATVSIALLIFKENIKVRGAQR